MKDYCDYMDSIQFSEEQKKKLTEQVKRRMVSGRTHTLRRLVPLAACLAVVAAVGGLVWPVLPLHEAAPDVVDSGEAPQADADPVQPQTAPGRLGTVGQPPDHAVQNRQKQHRRRKRGHHMQAGLQRHRFG